MNGIDKGRWDSNPRQTGNALPTELLPLPPNRRRNQCYMA